MFWWSVFFALPFRGLALSRSPVGFLGGHGLWHNRRGIETAMSNLQALLAIELAGGIMMFVAFVAYLRRSEADVRKS